MSATSPTQLSCDAFVSDEAAGAGDERMSDGAPLAWSRPALPGPCVAADPRIDARGGALALRRGPGPRMISCRRWP
jgi:hypothetical protein